MVRLTVEQNRIGQILEAGSLLLTAGDVSGQIEAQMCLLKKHWEQLRIHAMDRQTRFAALYQVELKLLMLQRST